MLLATAAGAAVEMGEVVGGVEAEISSGKASLWF
jgi:hypothetical protein